MSAPTDLKGFHAQRIAEVRANGGKLNPPLDTVPLLVLAAAGGAPRHPAWYHNLIAYPEVTVEIGGETFPARAPVATGAERDRLFAQHAASRPNFVEFQRQAKRQLPVIILERLPG